MVRDSVRAGTSERDRAAGARVLAASGTMTVLLALVAIMASPPVAAADQGTSPWVFEAYVNVFLPSNVTGTNRFPPEESSPPAGSSDIEASDSLVNLNGTFIGGFTARHERWGINAYVIYLDLEGTKTGSNVIQVAGHPLSAEATATARLGIRDTYALLAGTYRVVTDPNRPLDVLLGARLFNQHRTLHWQFSGSFGFIPPSEISGDRSVSQSGADAILGLTGRFGPTGHGWFAPYYLDVGTGNSSLTWQANAGFGYGWSRCEVALGWRYMHYQYPAQNDVENLNLTGPVLVFLVRW
jgi:hypothetical protein